MDLIQFDGGKLYGVGRFVPEVAPAIRRLSHLLWLRSRNRWRGSCSAILMTSVGRPPRGPASSVIVANLPIMGKIMFGPS
jgi:hypothetical protein